VAVSKNSYVFPYALDLNLILESTFNHYIIFYVYMYSMYIYYMLNYVLILPYESKVKNLSFGDINYLKYVLSVTL